MCAGDIAIARVLEFNSQPVSLNSVSLPNLRTKDLVLREYLQVDANALYTRKNANTQRVSKCARILIKRTPAVGALPNPPPNVTSAPSAVNLIPISLNCPKTLSL